METNLTTSEVILVIVIIASLYVNAFMIVKYVIVKLIKSHKWMLISLCLKNK